MTVDLARIEALTFDIGGTVFDWDSAVQGAIGALARERGADIDARGFSHAWRLGMFEVLEEVRASARPPMNADAMHRVVLDDLAGRYPRLALTPADRDALNRVWHAMPAWPGAAEAIAALRRHYVVVVFTILSWSIAVDSSKAAGIAWDGILSGEFMRRYKPDADAYRQAAELLRRAPGAVMMVAAHPSDLRAAAAAGLRTAYLRPLAQDPGEDYTDTGFAEEFDVVADGFADLTRRLAG